MTVLVTGASGNVGREVVRAARARGLNVVAADHKPERAKALHADVPVARLDFQNPKTWPEALAHGPRSVVLIRPPAIADVANNLNPFIDAARRAGGVHIVFLSVAGAGKNRFVPHRKVEDHLRRRSTHFTNLRPGFFAQNLATAYFRDIVEDGRIYVPAGRQPVNWIDVRDIAEVAARVLENPESHRAESYTLTGPGAVSWSEVASTLSDVLTRPIRYVPASVPGYVRHLSARGLPWKAIAVQTMLHVLLRFGQGASFDPTLQTLLGRPATSIHRYIQDNQRVWRPHPQNL